VKHELCPPECLFDPDDENIGVAMTCDGCLHSSDIMLEEPQSVQVLQYRDHWEDGEIIAFNGDKVYVRAGIFQTVFTMLKNSPLLKR
jgi:hypothetical protein